MTGAKLKILTKNILILLTLTIFYGCSGREKLHYEKLHNVINRYYIEDIEIKKSISLNETENINLLLAKLDKFSLYINDSTHIPKTIYHEKYSSKIIKNTILYIKVPYFDNNVQKNIQKSIDSLSQNITKIILDLRDNAGGNLQQAIKTVNLFIDDGLIITVRKKDKYNTRRYFASKNSTITNLPLIILVNKKSASSSEIVAGSLKYHKRAILIGEKTYGKGTIQAMIYLNKTKSEAIRLSVARYFFNDNIVNDDGVEVDIPIANDLIKDSALEKALLL